MQSDDDYNTLSELIKDFKIGTIEYNQFQKYIEQGKISGEEIIDLLEKDTDFSELFVLFLKKSSIDHRIIINTRGNTLLHLAAHYGDVPLAQALSRHLNLADLHKHNNAGKMPSDMAKRKIAFMLCNGSSDVSELQQYHTILDLLKKLRKDLSV